MSKEVKTYRYFDTPDGEDTLKKLWCATKYTGPLSLALATCDVMLHSHPQGYLPTVGRYIFYSVPILGMTSAFVLTTNYAANIRQKRDRLNWFLGALPAGAILGAWSKSIPIGFTACVAFGVAAALTRQGVDEGWTFIPESGIRSPGGIRRHKQDLTLKKDVPNRWL